jgi:glycine cleavage system protein P-like pyridoxal-binding family
MIPITQEYLDVGIESKIFDVASDTLPLNGAFKETILNISEVSKVHPMNKEMEGGGVRDREEEDRMIW